MERLDEQHRDKVDAGTSSIGQMFDDLTDNRAKLRKLENTIEQGLRSFLEVGKALLEIRDAKLYQPGYRTFEEYCVEKWRFDRSYAYRLMDAAKIADNLKTSPIGDILPANEAQTRPLGRLPADQQGEAWCKAVTSSPKGTMPTASQVQAVVNRMRADIREIKRSEGWTADDLAEDNELKVAFDSIAAAYGDGDAKAIKDGIIGYSRADVILLSKQPAAQLAAMQELVMGHHWRPKQCSRFLATAPDAESKIEDLIFYCVSTKEKVYRLVLGAFEITCKNLRFPPK